MAKAKVKMKEGEESAEEIGAEVVEEMPVEAPEVPAVSSVAPSPPPEPPKKAKEPKVERPLPEAQIKANPKDHVRTVCLEDIEPPPIIGHYNVGRELGITKMAKQANYHFPRYIAEHLADKQKIAILE